MREVVWWFDELGMESLDPRWAGGRPRRITAGDEVFIVDAAKARPEALGLPFTRWSLRKLAAYLAGNPDRAVRIGHERLSRILHAHDIAFQRTKTWKESNDPDRDAELGRIEEVVERWPDRCFAFGEFGPLQIRPVGGSAWAPASRPQRQPANYNKTHRVRQFHGCCSPRSTANAPESAPSEDDAGASQPHKQHETQPHPTRTQTFIDRALATSLGAVYCELDTLTRSRRCGGRQALCCHGSAEASALRVDAALPLIQAPLLSRAF